MSGAEYEKAPHVARAAASKVAAFAAALPAVSGCGYCFRILRRSDVSDPQHIALAFCGVRCAELYVLLVNERYCAEEGTCLSVSSIPFQRQRRVILQKSDGAQVILCVEKNKRLSVGQAYRVYLPVSTVVSEVKKTYLPHPCALAVEKIEPASFDCEESAD